jgi:predicted ArsR family transcriptional regulator
MLTDVLRLAATRGTLSINDIAAELAISRSMAAQALGDLVRLGFVKSAVSQCAAPCASCSSHDACTSRGEPALWVLTAKAERALASSHDAAEGRR